MKHSKALKKVLKQVVVGLIMCSMIIPGLTGIASASSAAGEIRWDFIEGKEVASIYKETTSDTATLDHGDGAVKINATKVTQGKAVGIALTDNITIDTDVHKYILFKADFPANITKISAYLYNSEGTNIAYGWANNANALFAGISEGTKVYALPLSASNSGTTANASAVVNGTYGKLEIRFRCGKTNESTLAENSVISIDYVAIGSYNKDAVMTDGTTTGSKKGTEEKTVMISAINVGSKAYALNETANGYTISGMSADYENLATASITATAAEGWTVSNTATKVTELTNHKIVDAVVTATNGSESKTASYRYVFYLVEETGDSVFTTVTTKSATSVNDKSVGSDGTFGEATAWSYNGTPNKEFLPIRGVNTNYSSNEGNGRDKNIGISTFDFSASKDFADEFVVTYNMWAGTDVLPGVYLVPDNATKLSDCTLLGKITATKWNNWAYSDFDVTETVKADDDGIITLGLYVADEDYATSTLKARQLLIQHSAGTRDGKAYGTINNRTDLANVPEKSTVTVTRKVVEGAEDAPVSIVPIIAHYNSDNQLVNCTLGQEFEHTGSSTVVSATLDTFSYEDGDYLRAFYWNNMLDITPVLDAQGL